MIVNDLSRAPKHTQIYYKAFGYSPGDFIPSEISGDASGAIHHIQRRGMGGSKNLCRIENCMSVTDQEHEDFGEVVACKAWLYRMHQKHLVMNNIPHDSEWINEQIKKYES